MKSPFSKTRTPVVESKPEIPAPAISAPAIAPSVLVPSPPAASPSQLDRIEAHLVAIRRRVQA